MISHTNRHRHSTTPRSTTIDIRSRRIGAHSMLLKPPNPPIAHGQTHVLSQLCSSQSLSTTPAIKNIRKNNQVEGRRAQRKRSIMETPNPNSKSRNVSSKPCFPRPPLIAHHTPAVEKEKTCRRWKKRAMEEGVCHGNKRKKRVSQPKLDLPFSCLQELQMQGSNRGVRETCSGWQIIVWPLDV